MPAPGSRKGTAERRFENRVVLGARRCRLAGRRVLCAASGGPDSTALAVALARRSEALGLAGLGLAHVDHGLRATSSADAEVVRKLSNSLGLPSHCARVTVDARKGGVEASARLARYAALSSLALESGYDCVVTGHTRTDQAETVLLRMIRGAGLRGLSAMAWVRRLAPGVRLCRPMLEISRAETWAYAGALGVEIASDESNLDRRFLRNALRAEAWPALERLSPKLEGSLAELARQSREDEAALDSLAEAAAETLSMRRRRGELFALRGRALAQLPPAVARRVLRKVLNQLRPAAQPSSLHLAALLSLCARGGTGEVHVAGDLSACLVRGRLGLAPRQR